MAVYAALNDMAAAVGSVRDGDSSNKTVNGDIFI